MLSSLAIFTFLILFLFIKDKLLLFLLFIPLILYFITFDLRDSKQVNDLLINHSIKSFNNYLIYGLVIFTSLIVLLIFDNWLAKKSNGSKKVELVYNLRRIKFCFYGTSFLSIIGSLINMGHVNYSFGLMLINPREYELMFGASTFINYLYFLSPISICLFIYLKHFDQKIRFSNSLITLLFLSSFLHGVKFTVFDTVLIPSFFYYFIKNRKVSIRIPLLVFVLLLAFYLAFSTFIRGGDGLSPIEQVISYIIPNYVNLAYSLNEKWFQWQGFQIYLPDKLPSFFDNYYQIAEEGFVLNDAYNMQTAYINYFRFAWYWGPILFLIQIVYLRRILINKLNKDLFNIFLVSMIDFCLLFVFFFHAFIKTKYWYLVAVIFLIHFFTKTKTTRIIEN
jgi:hypothetical protein